MDDLKEHLTTEEAAEVLDRSVESVRKYCNDEHWGLKCEKRGNRFAIETSSVLRLRTEMLQGLKGHGNGHPRLAAVPEELRKLRYAQLSIQSLDMAEDYEQPILDIIDGFMEPLTKKWKEQRNARMDAIHRQVSLEEPEEPEEASEVTEETEGPTFLDFSTDR
jgi:hypothetical protein